MVVNRKVTGTASSMPTGLAIGGCASLGITLTLAAILAKMVDKEIVAQENIGYGVMILLMLAASAGAWTAARKIKRQRLMVCALSGAIYMGILFSITALFFGGQYEAVGVTTLLVMGGSITAATVGTGEKRGVKGRKKIRAHR